MKRTRNIFTYVLLAAAAMAVPGARGDEAVEALAKYDKPVDAAVDKALEYLAGQQHKEGYWPSGLGKDPAIASLSVMAFLAKGHTPGAGPYGERINRGIDFVLSCAKPNGMLAGPSQGSMYIHGISTLMLSEVSGMVDAARQARIDKVLPQAVRLILTAQQVKKAPPYAGGWRYTPQSVDSDISLTGWNLMALRSARGNGALVPKETIDRAVEFVLRCRPAGAKVDRAKKAPPIGFAYQPGGPAGLARTGVALVCLELCGRHETDDALDAGDYVLANLPKNYGEAYFYYSMYYCSQGMFQLGGKHWEKFAPHMIETMLKFQNKDGSWKQGSSGEASGGVCYATAMSVLSLSVSYRQRPIYQR